MLNTFICYAAYIQLINSLARALYIKRIHLEEEKNRIRSRFWSDSWIYSVRFVAPINNNTSYDFESMILQSELHSW